MTKLTKQIEFWRSPFGIGWTDGVNIDLDSRVDTFRRMIGFLFLDDIEIILEVGCNKGYNLAALARMRETILIPRRDIKYKICGVDVSEYAIQEAKKSYGNVSNFYVGDCLNLPFIDSSFDCIISAGMLMHIAPNNLPAAIQELIRVSNRYILVIEYYSFLEEDISSAWDVGTGESMIFEEITWSRDYSNDFALEGMICIDGGFWTREEGWDNQAWWLFKKPDPLPFKVEFL